MYMKNKVVLIKLQYALGIRLTFDGNQTQVIASRTVQFKKNTLHMVDKSNKS